MNMFTWSPSSLESGKFIAYLRYLTCVSSICQSEETKVHARRLKGRFLWAIVETCGDAVALALEEKSKKFFSHDKTGFAWVDRAKAEYGPLYKTVLYADTPTKLKTLDGYRVHELYREAMSLMVENFDMDECANMESDVLALVDRVEFEKGVSNVA